MGNNLFVGIFNMYCKLLEEDIFFWRWFLQRKDVQNCMKIKIIKILHSIKKGTSCSIPN